jgi:hypothetical protein
MIVEVHVTIDGTQSAIWAAITDIEHAAEIISGIDKIEVVEKPTRGVVGLKWRETRMYFGKPATIEKWITDAAENDFYKTRAEDDGCIYSSTLRISAGNGGMTLTSAHEMEARTPFRKMMMVPMGLVFKGVMKKALLKDLDDIKSAVEARRQSNFSTIRPDR